MTISVLLTVLAVLFAMSFVLGRQRSISTVGGVDSIPTLHSLPSYYGYWTALSAGVPALLLLLLWITLQNNIITGLVVSEMPEEVRNLPSAELGLVINDVRNVADEETGITSDNMVVNDAAARFQDLQSKSLLLMSVFVISLALLACLLAVRVISPKFRARNNVEAIATGFLFVSSTVAVFTTVGIVLSVLLEAIRFFQAVPIWDFLFGLEWSPQTAIRSDQVGSSGAFGAVPLFAGTLLISGIAMFVAVPIGLMSAIYISEYASHRIRAVVKPALEVLAGIPTVVYGFFAALVVAPTIRG
ncbi:MAG: phosphate ABC transporter permease family protein, partial [Pseudomonadota bacterium]